MDARSMHGLTPYRSRIGPPVMIDLILPLPACPFRAVFKVRPEGGAVAGTIAGRVCITDIIAAAGG